MIDKLNKILEIIEKNHLDFYFEHSKEELEEYKKEALSKFKLEDDYDVLYVSNYLIKKMLNNTDAHTCVNLLNTMDNLLGLRFRIIKGKLYIYQTIDGYQQYQYCEVIKINDVDIDKIISEVRNIKCSQTKTGEEFKIESALVGMDILKSLPSLDSNANEFKITVKKDDTIEEFIAPKGRCPITNYEYSVSKDIMYIKYSRCSQSYDNQMLDFVKNISEVKDINYYIVDLRDNTGGNNKIANPLIEFLTGKNVIVLIDKYVFSACRFACVKLRNIGAIFIGTDIGTTLNCFGNIPKVEFDNFSIFASNRYFAFHPEITFDINSKETIKIIKDNKKYYEPIYFHPDIYVEESIEALREGKDVYMDAAYEYINNISNKKEQ